MRRLLIFIIFSLATTGFILAAGYARASTSPPVPVKIGVLAKRGAPDAISRWEPTAEYLTERVPGYFFTIVPLDFDEVRRAVAQHDVDFMLTNSGYYIELEASFGVSRTATLKNLWNGRVAKTFGGVIFTRADRKDINSLSDLRGKTFMAVERDSFGGWMAALKELRDHGLNPQEDFSVLGFGKTHDSPVFAVLDGSVDAGTVRTDTLERMAAEGKIRLEDFKVLNSQPATEDFPFLHSTALYPEWPWAKLKTTPDDLAEKVTMALLGLTPDHPAAKAADIAGWTVPLDYQPIHVLMKELKIGPYQDLGQVTLRDVVRHYFKYLLAGAALIGLMLLFTAYIARLNRRLQRTRNDLDQQLDISKAAEEALSRTNDELDIRVKKRTTQLSEANTRLIEENAERKKAEEALRRQKEFSDNIIRTASAMILTLDRQGRIMQFNEYAQSLTGYREDQAVGQDWFDLLVPEEQRNERRLEFDRFFQGDHYLASFENEVVCKDETRRQVAWRNSLLKEPGGRTMGALWVGVDITERRRAEEQARMQQEQLIQADKLVALGTLVAGVAHEINNPTTSIMMNAPNVEKIWNNLVPVLDEHFRDNGGIKVGPFSYEEARRRLPLLLDGIQDGARRVKRIVADLKDFARQEGSAGVTPVDVNQVVNRALSLLGNLIKKSTHCFVLDLEPELSTVMARSQRLEQVVINLVMNACQALSEPNQTVAIRTFEQSEENMVALVVADEGAGIPDEVLHRVTDPFFTTKRETGGTGLGLAICSRIVTDHGGIMRFDSKSGKGTTVTVLLPAVKQSQGDYQYERAVTSVPADFDRG